MTSTSSIPSRAGLLTNKVALVLGASRGIGASSAAALARAGARVVVAARDALALEAVAARIRQEGREAHAIPTDILDDAQVERLVAKIAARYGESSGLELRPRARCSLGEGQCFIPGMPFFTAPVHAFC